MSLFLMNVFLSIIVDGYIETNSSKKDNSSIVSTVFKSGLLRRPKDLGIFAVNEEPPERFGRNKDGGGFGKEDRVQLNHEIAKVVDDLQFSHGSIVAARQKVLSLMNHFMKRGRGGKPLGGLDSKVDSKFSEEFENPMHMTSLVPMSRLNELEGDLVDDIGDLGGSGSGRSTGKKGGAVEMVSQKARFTRRAEGGGQGPRGSFTPHQPGVTVSQGGVGKVYSF
jgi:hypothetical protein